MTSLGDYESAEYWATSGWMAPWLKGVDAAYWREMILCIGENWFRRPDWKEHILTEAGRHALRMHLCTRISQASEVFVPWLAQATKLGGLRVLEIGCGSGSTTAGLAHAGAVVTGVDIKGPSMTMAKKRLFLLDLEANFILAGSNWLNAEVDINAFAGPYGLVVCYAMLEHLLIPERIHLLTACRRIMERDGAMLATFETPNRFSPFDWHTSKLGFTDILPDELVYEFVRGRSPRVDHPAKRYPEFTEGANEAIYRFGRGVSWHEFDLAFGIDKLEVVLDGYSPKSQNQKSYRANEAYETALAIIFAEMEPSVPRGFCRTSLDLLLRIKNGTK
jgi:2-polyprenyl-3-methyl-5-hydroxy-6-metoxy-1,4-benzoquinol methylase